jgi:6-phosphogluconolactonase (cycloisomerase 2 family)
MRYAIALLFVLCCVAYTQGLTTKLNAAHSTLEQVLYVADATNLYTYDIDPQTFQPSLMGTIPLPKPQVNGLAVSSDGRSLYVMASDPYPATDNRIYVYDTNGYGVPGMPLQSLSATNESSMFVDPNDNFLYAVHKGTHVTKNLNLQWSIYRYEVNATNGELTQLVTEATYLLPDQGSNDCGLSIAGMNADGAEIYDYIFCSTGGAGTDGTYDERTVDPSTGALGIPQQIFYWSEGQIGNPQTVQIVGHLIFDFVIPVAQPPYEYNQLLVFPLTTKKNAKPLINCTATMLGACGSDIGVAHPSAKYVFYTNAQDNTTEVDAVNLSSKQIVSTGTTFSTPTPNVLEFSPDGSVVYSWDSTTSTISIFGFNASTAAITTGGSITDWSAIVILPTERR